MAFKNVLTNFFWKAEGCCPSFVRRQREKADGRHDDLVDGYLDVEPAAGAACYVAELLKGKVIGSAKLVSTRSNIVLGDVQFLYGAASPESHWILA